MSPKKARTIFWNQATKGCISRQQRMRPQAKWWIKKKTCKLCKRILKPFKNTSIQFRAKTDHKIILDQNHSYIKFRIDSKWIRNIYRPKVDILKKSFATLNSFWKLPKNLNFRAKNEKRRVLQLWTVFENYQKPEFSRQKWEKKSLATLNNFWKLPKIWIFVPKMRKEIFSNFYKSLIFTILRAKQAMFMRYICIFAPKSGHFFFIFGEKIQLLFGAKIQIYFINNWFFAPKMKKKFSTFWRENSNIFHKT